MAFRALQRHFRIGIRLRIAPEYYRVQTYSRNSVITLKSNSGFSICRHFGTPPSEAIFFNENLEKIQEDAAANHRIGKALFDKVLKQLKDLQTSRENVLFLLNSCANFFPDVSHGERSELAGHIWKHLNRQDMPKIHDYVTLREVKRKNRQCILNYKDFLKELRIPASPEIYEGLLYLAAECNLIEQVFKILAEMKELKYPATETVFNALILAYSRNRDLKNVELAIETMSAANVEQTPTTLAEIIKAYMENGSVERAMSLLTKNSSLLTTEQLVMIVRTALNNNVEASVVSATIKQFPVDILNRKQIC
ncbi:hypothetical protein DMENIID0001_053540 [Sergentomyia squamirostris]